jgi:aminoglycoside phosphotransferase (APT) family kinase protein
MTTARLRARQALLAAGLGGERFLEEVPTSGNEVWFAGPFVVRVNTSRASHRLEHEAAVAAVVPPEVPYPEVVAAGSTSVADWMITKRVPGMPLSRAWPAMTERWRTEAVTQLGVAMRALHRTPAPDAVAAAGDAPDCPHALPPARLLAQLDRAAALPYVDEGVVQRAREVVLRAADALDPGPFPTLVHGDLHFENVLWDGERVTAVLDLEWARPGPPDLDLDVLLRFCADPTPQVDPAYRHLVSPADFRQVPRWLRTAYPELFAAPRLDERLAVYCLAYDVPQLLADPPHAAAAELPHSHPLQRIRRLLDGRAHLPLQDW